MLSALALISIIASSVYANGELNVLHHPRSIYLKGDSRIKESLLKEIYSAVLGFSTEQFSNWDGLYIEDPFNLAEAVVTVSVDGLSSIGYTKGHRFPLKTDDDDVDVYESLRRRVIERYPESNSEIVLVDLANGLEDVEKSDILRGIKDVKPKKHSHFKLGVDEDRDFLTEITLLNAIITKIESSGLKPDYSPDVYWFRFGSLHPLVDLHGENSTQVKEARQLLIETLTHLNRAFDKVYNGRVFVNVISSDAVHTRRSRNILQAPPPVPANEGLNLAKQYGGDYPVIFNIILWFGVTMFFAILAVCIAIGTMDPGRDSIIYRMTSTRIKKDN